MTDVREIAIAATETTLEIAGRPLRLRTYNGQLPGPTLEAREGERLRIVFTNHMREPTNFHLHGMHMPPEVDDPHRVAGPGETLVYEFDVPVGAAGTYWYHPHVHGEVARQLGEGLAGALVVRGPDDDQPALAGVDEHVLVLQDLSPGTDAPRLRTAMELHDGREGDLVLVSGRVTPRLAASGGLVRLRVVNASCARFYDLVLEGAAEMHVIGVDASLVAAPVAVESFLLPPGQRVDLLVRATAPGPVTLRHRPYHRGTFKWPWARGKLPDDGVLATLDVATPAAQVALPVLRPIEQLDPRDAVATRIFEYGGAGGGVKMLLALLLRKTYGPGEGNASPVRFWINGREFEPGRIDAEAQLDTMEIWELRNPTPLDHPFHLHIYPFQVLDLDGVPPAFTAWRDVVTVPARSTVRIMIPFRDFPGLTMFHCHIVEHEDNGMMAHLLVVDPERPDAPLCAHHRANPHA